MKFFVALLLLISFRCFSQNKVVEQKAPKGDHFLLYNKCLVAITFCEITQQSYTICGSVKNCHGLYVMPGDTFYVNIEDKNQLEIISADISFGGYFPAIANFIFQPIDNNCLPQHALQIAIPLTAVPGSSFQIIAQNTTYVNSSVLSSGVPLPFDIYIGGQQPQFAFALSDFTVCPAIEQLSVDEVNLDDNSLLIFPNPSTGSLSLLNLKSLYFCFEMYDLLGNLVLKQTEITPKTFDITNLNNGVYLCKLIYQDKLIATKKLILMK